MQTAAEREAHLRVLANQLFFVVEKTGQRFTLKRTTDVPKPVCEEGLTLTEAEQLLQRWKPSWVSRWLSPIATCAQSRTS
jgi:hypothetical protein